MSKTTKVTPELAAQRKCLHEPICRLRADKTSKEHAALAKIMLNTLGIKHGDGKDALYEFRVFSDQKTILADAHGWIRPSDEILTLLSTAWLEA